MILELKGKIEKIGEIQTFASGFQKREFILSTDETYSQHVPFELIQDKVDIIDAFKVGDEALVGFNCMGRKWTSPQGEDKHFLSLKAWKITKPNPIDTTGKVSPGNINDAFGDSNNPFGSDDSDENLPF